MVVAALCERRTNTLAVADRRYYTSPVADRRYRGPANDRMKIALRREALSSVCSMALLIGGCPKRQTTPRVVYVPATPPEAAPAPTEKTETLVVEEPPPPEPQEVAPGEPAAQKPTRHRRRHLTRPDPAAAAEPAPASSDAQPGAPEIPALEPRESPEQGVALRQQILALQQGVEQQIAQIGRMNLTAANGKTLEDARTFLNQSRKAFEDGDLQRALTLARKASLLAAALEQQP